MRREELGDDVVGLDPHGRADRVDEHAAGANQRRDAVEQRALQRREPRQVIGPAAPAQLGVAAERPQPGARRVDQDGVEGPAHRRPARVGHHDADAATSEPLRLRGDAPDAGRVRVERQDASRGAAERRRVRSSCRRARRRRRVRARRARRRAGASRAATPRPGRRSRPARNCRQRPQRGRPRVRPPAHRAPSGSARRRRPQPPARRRARRACTRSVFTRTATRPAPVVRREQRRQLVRRHLLGEPLDQPPRVRPLDGEPRRADPWRGRASRASPPFARGAPQDRVHQSRGAAARHAAPAVRWRRPRRRRARDRETGAGRGRAASATRTGGSSRATVVPRRSPAR